MAILQELRFVSMEVGLHEARRMPTEVRRWWIEEMQRERQSRNDEVEQMSGRKKVTDVPRGRK